MNRIRIAKLYGLAITSLFFVLMICDLGSAYSSNQADVVFVFDTTGSMGGSINSMKANAINFANALAESGIDFRLGLTEFKDFPNSCGSSCGGSGDFAYNVYNGGNLVSNVATFNSWISSLYASGGADGPESHLAALHHTATDQHWRGSTVQKIIIFISDAPPHADGHCCNVEGDTFAGTKNFLTSNLVTVFIAGYDSGGAGVPDGWATDLATSTGGKFYRLGDLTPILKDIRNMINPLSGTLAIDLSYKNTILEGESTPISIKVLSNSKPVAGNIKIFVNNQLKQSATGPDYTYQFTPPSFGVYDIVVDASYGKVSKSEHRSITVLADVSRTLALVDDLRQTAQDEIYDAEDTALSRHLKSLLAVGTTIANQILIKADFVGLINKVYPLSEHPAMAGWISGFVNTCNKATDRTLIAGGEKIVMGKLIEIFESLPGPGDYDIGLGRKKIENEHSEFDKYIYNNRDNFRDPSKFWSLVHTIKTSLSDIVEAREISNSAIGHTEDAQAKTWDSLDWLTWATIIVVAVICLCVAVLLIYLCIGTLNLGCIIYVAGYFAGFLSAVFNVAKFFSWGLTGAKYFVSIILLVSMFNVCSIIPSEHSAGLDAIKDKSLSTTMSALEMSYPAHVNKILAGRSTKILSNGYIFAVRPDGKIYRLEEGEFRANSIGRYTVLGYQHNNTFFSNIAPTAFDVSKPNITIDASYTLVDKAAKINLLVSNHEVSTMENLIVLLNLRNSTKYSVYDNGDSINLAAGESRSLSYEVNLVDNDIYLARAMASQSFGDILAEKTLPIQVGISTLEDAAILDISSENEYSPHDDVTFNVTMQSFVPALGFDITIPSLNYSKPVVVTGIQEIEIALPKLKPDYYTIAIKAEKSGKVLDSRIINFYVRADGVGFLTFNTSQILYTTGELAEINLSLKDLYETNVDAQVKVNMRDPEGGTHDFAATEIPGGYQFDFQPAANGTYMLEAYASKEGWRIDNNTFTVIVGEMSHLKMDVTIDDYVIANVTSNGIPAACNVTMHSNAGDVSDLISNGMAVFSATNRFYLVANKMFFEPAYFSYVEPAANFTIDTSNPRINQVITFNGSQSYDPDGDVVQYNWDFGDGNKTNTAKSLITHAYSVAGKYAINLTITDNVGARNSTIKSLHISALNVSGIKFDDVNGNGLKDSGELGLSSWTIKLTKPDGSNLTTVTGTDGKYQFEIFRAGTYMVSEVNQDGWIQTYPAMPDHYNVLISDSNVTSIDFGNKRNNLPPSVPSIPFGPKSGYAWVPYNYSTSAKDPNEDQVQYTFNWSDGKTNVTDPVNSGTIANATHLWDKAGTYQVKAMTTDSNGATSGWSDSFAVTIAANQPPKAPSKPIGPASGTPRTTYLYMTSATDPNGDKVMYTYDWDDGTTFTTKLVKSGTKASISHSWSKAGEYHVKIMTTDSKGASSGWSPLLTATINTPPKAPSKPVGPLSGKIGIPYDYSTLSLDHDGDPVKYTFNWGDGSTAVTDPLDPGISAMKAHAWKKAGAYRVKVMATDSKGASSGWSTVLNVKIAK